jgi:hypothetical protein
MTLDRLTQSQIERVTTNLVDEFDGVFACGTIARLVQDSLERLGDMTVTRFIPVLVERVARDRLIPCAQADGLLCKDVVNLVFICTENAGRSQMAPALAHHVSEGRIAARSADSNPVSHIDLTVVDAMAELQIGMAFEFPKPVTAEVLRAADVVVTMGCNDACPDRPGPAISRLAHRRPGGPRS